MRLPRLFVLTDQRQARAPLIEVVAACVAGGARAVVLREKHLPAGARAALAARLRPLLAEVDGRLLGASDPGLSRDGVHLAADDPVPTGLAPSAWVGRSCHDRDDLAAAAAQGCTHATLSPIVPTASKPGYGPALGTGALADPPLPTYALGGIDGPAAAIACVAAGAHGVAVMGALMRADRPDRLVADLLGSLPPTPEPPA